MKYQHTLLRSHTVVLGAFLLAALAGTTHSVQAQTKAQTPVTNPTKPPAPVTPPAPATPPANNTNGVIILPQNGVFYEPGIVSGGNLVAPSSVGEVRPGQAPVTGNNNANVPTSVPTGNLKGRPIRVRKAPTQPAGTQRLLNNSNLPIFTGVVTQAPGKAGFQMLVGKYPLRINNTRKNPSTLSVGDLVQVQGLRRGNTVRAGSVSILRDR